jgi:hypothetical protein
VERLEFQRAMMALKRRKPLPVSSMALAPLV